MKTTIPLITIGLDLDLGDKKHAMGFDGRRPPLQASHIQ